MISRNYNYEKTKIKLEKFLKWRKKKNLNRIFETDFKELLKILNRGKYNIDKKGRPIIINQLGNFKPELFLEKFKFEDLEDFLIKMYEQLFYIVFPICSKIANKKIDKVFVIMDLKGVQLKKIFNSDFRGVLKKLTKATSAYFPETLGKVFILNAPFYFRFIWKIVQYWIDEKTRTRFEIFSGNGEKALKEMIDERDLPVFLGGKCEEKLQDEPGPWNDYIIEAEKNKSMFIEDLKKYELKYFYTKQERNEYKKMNENKIEEIREMEVFIEVKEQIGDLEIDTIKDIKVIEKIEDKGVETEIIEIDIKQTIEIGGEDDGNNFEDLRQSEIAKINEILDKVE